MTMQHVFPTYQRFPFVIEDGQGVHLTDNHGNTYLDFTAGIGSVTLATINPRFNKRSLSN
ncbi:acetylornithine aminotransferase [Lactiplantibacillus plantarum]|nr:acetylornithine aminotransferase [Lactiplantibacillus plantarum]